MERAYAAGIGLDVDTPLRRIEMEGLKGTFATEDFQFVDVLVATIVASIGKTLGVLVGQDRAIGLHGSTTRQVLHNGSGKNRSNLQITYIEHTSEAMSSRPVSCLHVSLSMIFCTSESISANGA